MRLTNPNGQKDYVFTLISTSQPDADDDGIENMLDTCALDPNIEDTDGRSLGAPFGDRAIPTVMALTAPATRIR